MATWLYDSDGEAIAFAHGKYIFTRQGIFLGMLYEDNTVWNGEYIGTIIGEDRLFYDVRNQTGTRGVPGMPGLPPFVGEPRMKQPVSCPQGYRDIDAR